MRIDPILPERSGAGRGENHVVGSELARLVGRIATFLRQWDQSLPVRDRGTFCVELGVHFTELVSVQCPQCCCVLWTRRVLVVLWTWLRVVVQYHPRGWQVPALLLAVLPAACPRPLRHPGQTPPAFLRRDALARTEGWVYLPEVFLWECGTGHVFNTFVENILYISRLFASISIINVKGTRELELVFPCVLSATMCKINFSQLWTNPFSFFHFSVNSVENHDLR